MGHLVPAPNAALYDFEVYAASMGLALSSRAALRLVGAAWQRLGLLRLASPQRQPLKRLYEFVLSDDMGVEGGPGDGVRYGKRWKQIPTWDGQGWLWARAWADEGGPPRDDAGARACPSAAGDVEMSDAPPAGAAGPGEWRPSAEVLADLREAGKRHRAGEHPRDRAPGLRWRSRGGV